MEKRKPHYSLARIKELIENGAYHVTESALASAARDFLIDRPSGIASNVLRLERQDFYKSMTTYRNVRLWQDVYHLDMGEENAYVKLQIVDERTVVISFKSLEEY